MNNDTLARIQTWYLNQCDGDWEHGYGLQISTLDNPGWRVKITLECTPLRSKTFEPVTRGMDTDQWIHCEVKKGEFQGNGGPEMLGEILKVFLDWAEADKS